MQNPRKHSQAFLAVIVLAHLAVAVLHGAAHRGAQVTLTPAANDFVIVVIIVGPLVGLVMTWAVGRSGAVVVAATMLGAFLFGVINHFVLQGDDHVSHVADQWRTLFGTTAAFLALFEAAGAVYATRLALRYNPREVMP